MSKNEYLDALKKALAGLPPDTAAKTMAYYEQRFIDSLGAGKTEEEIAAELDDPRKIAMTLRANAHRSAFEQKRNPANLARMMFSSLASAFSTSSWWCQPRSFQRCWCRSTPALSPSTSAALPSLQPAWPAPMNWS